MLCISFLIPAKVFLQVFTVSYHGLFTSLLYLALLFIHFSIKRYFMFHPLSRSSCFCFYCISKVFFLFQPAILFCPYTMFECSVSSALLTLLVMKFFFIASACVFLLLRSCLRSCFAILAHTGPSFVSPPRMFYVQVLFYLPASSVVASLA